MLPPPCGGGLGRGVPSHSEFAATPSLTLPHMGGGNSQKLARARRVASGDVLMRLEGVCDRIARFARGVTAAAVAVCAVVLPAHAQEEGAAASAEARPFRLYRWQEDYSYLANRERTGWEQLKYILLPGLPNSYLSLGGELRNRIDAYDPYLFGIGRSGFDWASEQARLFQHFDLHLGKAFRAFLQLDTSFESGRPVQRAFDQSPPDVRLAFGDLLLPVGAGTAMLRGGRQDLYLGPSRWLAIRDPTNIRRSFDGVLVEYSDPNVTLRGFAARPVNILPDAFDDRTFQAEFFRGGYATVRRPFGVPVTVDGYVYGKQQDSATFARGTASEDRWTGGGRIAANFAGFETIGEAAYQWGTFGNARIAAVGAFGDAGYRFAPFDASPTKVTPKTGVRAHYASGDDDLRSRTFRNFTGAYPAASVISEMSLISVSNVTNVQPYVQFFISSGPVVGASWNFVRKVTTADSVYGPIGTLITARNSTSLDVAQIGQLDLTWDLTRFVQLHALYAHIFAGQYIKDAGGRSFDYYRLQVMARW
jgi:hypothetical protein